MTHATMCAGDDDGTGCFVPWCTCSCHHPGSSDPHFDNATVVTTYPTAHMNRTHEGEDR